MNKSLFVDRINRKGERMNITDWLTEKRHSNSLAIVSDDTCITYKQLYNYSISLSLTNFFPPVVPVVSNNNRSDSLSIIVLLSLASIDENSSIKTSSISSNSKYESVTTHCISAFVSEQSFFLKPCHSGRG